MSALSEGRCYGLSSGKLNRDVSVFHVKLTDTAARAIGAFQNAKGWSSHPTICFNGNQGRITVPFSDNKDEFKIFTFGVTNVARDNPHGSFDCVEQLHTGAAEELSCLGVIQKKMTVNATDDSYDKARQNMAQAEEETRSRGAIVIKHGGRFQGKKVTVRAPAPALAGLSKPRQPQPPSQSQSQSLLSKKGGGLASKLKKGGACAPGRQNKSDVQQRPLRERLTHLLALRPYKKPEIMLRLQKDGLSAEDKDILNTVVTEVAQLNSRDNTFVLKDSLYKDLQKDWPGYTTGDQQLLKRILVRRLFQPQHNLLTAPEAQVSPLRDTPNSSPAHRPKLPVPEEYTDPLVSKKPRISHLSNKTSGSKSRSRPAEQAPRKEQAEARGEEEEEDERKRNSLDPRKLFDSLSDVCQQEDEVAQRLESSPCAQEEEAEAAAAAAAKSPEDRPVPDCDRPPSPLIVPDLSRHTTKRKKSKHKHREEKKKRRGTKDRRKGHSSEDANDKELQDCSEPSEILFDSNELQTDNDSADYLSMYTEICSHDQRQSYKQDFNKEYNEYRDLHARIDGVTRQFLELETQLKQLHQESHKYKTVHNQILQEYRKIKKSNPNYNQDKLRCEYLHNKLAHIKRLISEYDKHQLSEDHSCPK